MKVEEVRLINESQGTGRVFFHLKNGDTVCRIMTGEEVKQAQILRKKEGLPAFTAELVRLYNEKYSAPQKMQVLRLKTRGEVYARAGIADVLPEEEWREIF